MKNLYVLHEDARLAAPLVADIHLRPMLTACCKILSSAVTRLAPLEVSVKRNQDGAKEFKYDGVLIMPPYASSNPWVDWACESRCRAWWLIETAWWLDKELAHRFNMGQSVIYLRMNKIVEKGFARHFPSPPDMVTKIDGWPIPSAFKVSIDEIDNFRTLYKSLQGKLRMKWTNRMPPSFMVEKEICPSCLCTPPKSGPCDVSCFYAKN